MNNKKTRIGIAFVGTTRGLQYKGSKFCEEQDVNDFKVMLATPRSYYSINPDRNYWIVLSQKGNNGNVITLYGLYRYAIEMGESRKGGYYGGVVIVQNGLLNATKVMQYLETIVTSIKKSHLDENNQFIADISSFETNEIDPNLDSFQLYRVEKNIIEYLINPFDKSEITDFISGANNMISAVDSSKIMFIASEGKGTIEIRKHINTQNVQQLNGVANKLLEEAKQAETGKLLAQEKKNGKNGGTTPPPKGEIIITGSVLPKTKVELEQFILKVIKENPDEILTILQSDTIAKQNFTPNHTQTFENGLVVEQTFVELDYDDSSTWKPYIRSNWKKWTRLVAIFVFLVGIYCVYPYINFDFLATKTTQETKPNTSKVVIPAKPEERTSATTNTCDCFTNKSDKTAIIVKYHNKTPNMPIDEFAKKMKNICQTCADECKIDFVNHVSQKNTNDASAGVFNKAGDMIMFFKPNNCISVISGKIFEDDDENGGLKQYTPPLPIVKPKPVIKAKTTKTPESEKWKQVESTPTSKQTETPTE